MRQILKITQTFLTTYYAYMVEYRAELFLWALSGTLPFILMGIWIKASQTGNLELSSIEFARYFLATFIVRQANVVWVIWEFEKEVIQGKLSPRLLQPIDPVWHHFLSHVAERFARLPFIIGLIILFFALYPESFWIPSLGRIFLFLFVLILAFLLRFIMQYTFALFSFWTERASAIEQIWYLPYLFLSGIIAPLTVFPPLIREITL
ncbi:MAG TPA: multidrug ABC transporter permease, partial [Oscillatoriales bacterium UBA8482]|nr:multidrug ABC transporter permease [Oscillatoriales bacterium UBA8482]